MSSLGDNSYWSIINTNPEATISKLSVWLICEPEWLAGISIDIIHVGRNDIFNGNSPDSVYAKLQELAAEISNLGITSFISTLFPLQNRELDAACTVNRLLMRDSKFAVVKLDKALNHLKIDETYHNNKDTHLCYEALVKVSYKLNNYIQFNF